MSVDVATLLTPDGLRAAVVSVLEVAPDALADDTDLLGAGMDSISVMNLSAQLRAAGAPVKFADLIEGPTLVAWSALVARAADASGGGAPRPDVIVVKGDDADDGAPFELGAMQHAYWAGRMGEPGQGGASHFYCEFDGAVDAGRLEAAVRALIERHAMLRVRFTDDGRQQVLAPGAAPWSRLIVHDLRAREDDATAEELAAIREREAQRALRVEDGEVFDVQLSLLPGGRTRVHVNVDMLVADAAAFRVVLRDLAALYRGDPLPPLRYSFRRNLADTARSRAAAREEASSYWLERIAELPDGPGLPGPVEDAAVETSGRVTRFERWVTPAERAVLEARARALGVTPSMALAAAFAEVVAAWSAERRFLLNLPLFNRELVHEDVPALVGDFTEVLLLDVDSRDEVPFAARAAAVQRRFRSDVRHAAFTGVDVLRELTRLRGGDPASAPVVFTSTIGMGSLFGDDVRAALGELAWISSQTAGVCLDHQAIEDRGGILLNWDVVADRLAPGVPEAMFSTYRRVIDWLVADDADWFAPIPAMVDPSPLPEVTGVVAATEGELRTRSLRLGHRLMNAGVVPGDRVGVILPDGPERLVAVLAVLASGAAIVVPDAVDAPLFTAGRAFADAGVSRVVTSGAVVANVGAPDTVELVLIDDEASWPAPLAEPVPVALDQPAWVAPGGVASRRDLVRVVDALAAALGPGDRVLSASGGLLGPLAAVTAGAEVVFLAEGDRRNPASWVTAARRHGVTALDATPAWYDLFQRAGGSARVVWLGGDRMPADHPRPPLRRGPWRVVDSAGRDRPDWVVGEIAVGNLRTGDLGRTRPDGTIEPLGRVELMIEARGRHLNLAAIEASLEAQPGVRRAVAAVVEETVVAVVEAALSRADCEVMRAAVGIGALTTLDGPPPVTPAGTWDRSAVARLVPVRSVAVVEDDQAVGGGEELIAQAWRRLLDIERVGRHDNFFNLGGDSLLATKFVQEMRDRGIEVTLRRLFSAPTPALLADVIANDQASYEEGVI